MVIGIVLLVIFMDRRWVQAITGYFSKVFGSKIRLAGMGAMIPDKNSSRQPVKDPWTLALKPPPGAGEVDH
jgi:hypothetical protein